MAEGMKKVRAELGVDAVILNSKEITQKGMLGIFKKRKIEIIAALDPQPMINRPVKPLSFPREVELRQDNNKYESAAVLQEIKTLKRMFEANARVNSTFTGDYEVVYRFLLEQELTESLAKDLIGHVIKIQQEVGTEPIVETIINELQKELMNRIHAIHMEQTVKEQQIIHFVGPTGVGKTTTLAKVAAQKMLIEKKKVAFITSDTYRIAAIEQLKTYARILDIPIEVAYQVEDYKNAIEKFSDCDVILVDTAGRNYRDKQYVKELFQPQDKPCKTFIVLALTAKPKDIIDIYQQFEHLPNKEIIFTKIDETRQYGSMVNLMLEKQVNIAYLTNGQDVPEDIFIPTPERISNLIVGGLIDS